MILLAHLFSLLLYRLLYSFNQIFSFESPSITPSFVSRGSETSKSPKELAEKVDLIITCLPSPKICSEVMEKKDGVIEGLAKNKIWLEMSTTDDKEIKRLG